MEKSELVALYDKMKLIMAETERLKPGFIQVAEAVWYAFYCYMGMHFKLGYK